MLLLLLLLLMLPSVRLAPSNCNGSGRNRVRASTTQRRSLFLSCWRQLLPSPVTLCCVQVVCDLIEEEAEMLGGSEHVMLAGFSQGGALALHIAVHSGIQ